MRAFYARSRKSAEAALLERPRVFTVVNYYEGALERLPIIQRLSGSESSQESAGASAASRGLLWSRDVAILGLFPL